MDDSINLNALGVLQAARFLLEDDDNWTTGWLARDVNGRALDSLNDSAVCWCSIGATSVSASPDCAARARALKYLRAASPEDNIAFTNDRRTHAEVLKMFDDAIAALAQKVDQ